jgi:hypothetical protein
LSRSEGGRGLPGEFEWLERLNLEELRQLADGTLNISQFQPSDGADQRPSVN